MILQALVEYYERKAADPENLMAPEGFEWKDIPFLVVIDQEGRFVRIEDTREGEGKNRKVKSFLVPQGEKKTVGIKANLLWDGPEYLLGANPRERSDAAQRHAAFVEKMQLAFASHQDHPAIAPILRFLASEPLSQVTAVGAESPDWREALETNANMTFRVEGRPAADPDILDLIADTSGDGDSGLCLVTGQESQITRLHPAIKGVWDAQPSGAALISYNLPAFRSFGKEQNFNAPVGRRATFAYTTALNHLLRKDSGNRLQMGDASTVFWAQKPDSQFEKKVSLFFSSPQPKKDDPDQGAADAKASLMAVVTGIPPAESDSLFFILGLSPNAARVSVRFWHCGTVAEFADSFRRHLLDLEIVTPKFDQERMGLMFLLCSTVFGGKAENIPPNLAGNVMQAVLTNSPYPETLQQQCLRRIRAERQVSRPRAAILKACLNRKSRRKNLTNEKEITVSLDPTNTNPGYRLGRLFAVLEKIQEDANPGLNATIRDRFYGAASSNPVAVFPQLLKLKNHHLAKLESPGFRIGHEKRLAEIFDGIGNQMPAHLSMDDQAKFAIGYYHQRQALFTKNETNEGEKK